MLSGVYKIFGMLMELKVIDILYSSVFIKLILVFYWEIIYIEDLIYVLMIFMVN